MRCPFCGADDTRVVDSRLANEGDQVRRRRRCVACDERFTTYEVAELTMPRVIKSNAAREPFNDDKLRGGIMRALEKRPVPIDKIEASLSRIRKKLLIGGNAKCLPPPLANWSWTSCANWTKWLTSALRPCTVVLTTLKNFAA